MGLRAGTTPEFDLNRATVAKPCSANWNEMTGDERARHCAGCGMNVYNISAMTANEARGLIASHEGTRLCIRLFKRADGTVITRDCPKGLAAYRRCVTRVATAAFASILGLFSVSYSQMKPKEHGYSKPATATQPTLTGIIVDSNGAFIPGAKITLRSESKKFTVRSDSNGYFTFRKWRLSGTYQLTAKFDGFKPYTEKISIREGEEVNRRIKLEVGSGLIEVGIFAADPMIDPTTSDIRTTFRIKDGSSPIPH